MRTTDQQNTLQVVKQSKKTMEIKIVTIEQAVIELTMNDLYLLGDKVRQELTNGILLRNANYLYYIEE
jgi:hypothetical protein